MKKNWFAIMCIAAVVTGSVCATARADLPADQTIMYNIRETPSNAASDIIFTITLDLEADQLDGDSVGWNIGEIRFERISDGKKWTEDFGGPSSYAPGLWWIDHADHDDPQLAEFADPPLLDGRADAVATSDPDLDYTLEGGVCNAACQAMYGGNVAGLDVLLWVVEETEPEVDDDDEPAEVEPGDLD